jgi:hypothetical protein
MIGCVQASSNFFLTASEAAQALVVAMPHWSSAYDIYKTPGLLDQELEDADPIVVKYECHA